jgi:hypothetical protein
MIARDIPTSCGRKFRWTARTLAPGTDSGFGGIAPGTYLVSSSLLGENQSSSLGSQSVTLSADSTIDLSDAVPTSVKGKVILDGEMPPSMSVWMENLHNGNQAVALVNPGGAFDFSDVQPGRYALLLANAAVLKPVFRSVKIKASSRSSIAFAVIFWISFRKRGDVEGLLLAGP